MQRSGVVVERLELHWSTHQYGDVLYALYAVDSDGQLELVGKFEQGPFDTALEVAQWAVKTISKWVPPSRC